MQQNLSFEMQENSTYNQEGYHAIAVQAPTQLKPQHIYKLTTSDNLPGGLIPLVVDHKISHKYLKILNIPVLNISYNRVDIPRSTVFSTFEIS